MISSPTGTGPTVRTSLDLILEWTDEHDHLGVLLNTRIQAAGGVRESQLDPFIFEILEDLEGRLQVRLQGPQTAQGMKGTVHDVIEEMILECQARPQRSS